MRSASAIAREKNTVSIYIMVKPQPCLPLGTVDWIVYRFVLPLSNLMTYLRQIAVKNIHHLMCHLGVFSFPLSM